MTQSYQLTVHEYDPLLARTASRYAHVKRDWPSVPRAGDMVSLGGGDAVVLPVAFVEFLDGKVTMHFNSDAVTIPARLLTDLGFSLPDS